MPKRIGRSRIEITQKDLDQIAMLAGMGVSEANIALVMGFSHSTLGRRKKDTEQVQAAIALGRAKAEASVAKSLYNMATVQNNLSAIIWYEKTRCGRSDRSQVEIVRAVEQELEATLDKLETIMPPDDYANLLDYLAILDGSEEA